MVLVEDKPARFQSLRETIREWIQQQTNLLGVIVTVRALAPQQPRVFQLDGNLLIQQSLGFSGLDHALILNPAFDTAKKGTLRKS